MPRWTEKARQLQAERIRALCPWKKSTGPRTEEGKARSARNAWKGGVRADAAAYARILRGFAATSRRLFSSFGRKQGGGNVQHRRYLNFASIADPLAVCSSGSSFDRFTANETGMDANGNPEGRCTPLLGPSPPAELWLFSSFGQKWDSAPDSDCELEKLSTDEFLAVAAGLLGGGCSVPFARNPNF